MPQFGELRDDSIYYVSAKRAGFRATAASLRACRASPRKQNFPPLYPLLLSAAWKVDPSFPHNLRTAAWISWLGFPAMMAILMMYYPRMGFSGGLTWLMLAILAINPFLILFSSRLVSEIWFTAFALMSLFLAEEETSGVSVALVAGALGGPCLLNAQRAGIVMLASSPLVYWMRGRRMHAVCIRRRYDSVRPWMDAVEPGEYPSHQRSGHHLLHELHPPLLEQRHAPECSVTAVEESRRATDESRFLRTTAGLHHWIVEGHRVGHGDHDDCGCCPIGARRARNGVCVFWGRERGASSCVELSAE